MQEDSLIQKDLFDTNEDNTIKNDKEYIQEDLTNEELKEVSKQRPRKRKNSINLISSFKQESNIDQSESITKEPINSYKSISKSKLPPVLHHYVSLKEEYENSLLLYRLGDFFECFFEDAILMSELLEITLTSKDGGKEIGKVPMAGVPHHALERYCADLIKKNHSVVICDQLEKSSGHYGTPLKRGVTRIITPGTVIEEGMLVAKKNNWITAVYLGDKNNNKEHEWGISKADVSTGELITLEGESISKLNEEITKIDNSELIIGSDEEKLIISKHNSQVEITVTQKTHFSLQESHLIIKEYFDLITLEGIGLDKLSNATRSLGGLLSYLKKINPSQMETDSSIKLSIELPQLKYLSENLILDYQTMRNLEILSTQRDNKYVGTLLWSIDRTRTAMGARCLRRWIEAPLLDEIEICKRQNIISNFLESQKLRLTTENLLRAMGDLERLAGRASAGQASARDLIAISEGLKKLPNLKLIIKSFKYNLPDWVEVLLDLDSSVLQLADQISFVLVENPPLNISEGGLIHDGVDSILDGLRNVIDDYDKWLKKEQVKERKLSKINNLKIQYHRTFGYYISVNKSKANLAPKHWIKRQTLTNEERFVTSEIKAKEGKIFQAKNRAASREYEIFCEIRNIVAEKTQAIRTIARSIANLDVLLGLANVSIENNYVKPNLIPMKDCHSKVKTFVRDARNPIVEQLLSNKKFVPNDFLFNDDQKLIILTGPNASGKSCFIRQIGLIQLLAQIGSYVPAKEATIKIVDRIFTRVGAVDDQSSGQSTFMVEMSETATILNQATQDSLVLLDEIGRGTSTFDGLSIAWSVSEYLAKNILCKSIFATHYHELNYLKKSVKNVSNFQVTVKQIKDKLEFCHKIEEGGANKSYGIEAARLAGVPSKVINKAKSVLSYLEKNNKLNAEIHLDSSNEIAA